jgi:hypothetical protein
MNPRYLLPDLKISPLEDLNSDFNPILIKILGIRINTPTIDIEQINNGINSITMYGKIILKYHYIVQEFKRYNISNYMFKILNELKTPDFKHMKYDNYTSETELTQYMRELYIINDYISIIYKILNSLRNKTDDDKKKYFNNYNNTDTFIKLKTFLYKNINKNYVKEILVKMKFEDFGVDYILNGFSTITAETLSPEGKINKIKECINTSQNLESNSVCNRVINTYNFNFDDIDYLFTGIRKEYNEKITTIKNEMEYNYFNIINNEKKEPQTIIHTIDNNICEIYTDSCDKLNKCITYKTQCKEEEKDRNMSLYSDRMYNYYNRLIDDIKEHDRLVTGTEKYLKFTGKEKYLKYKKKYINLQHKLNIIQKNKNILI